MSLNVTILGCGSSSGVPTVGNNWGKCNPKNKKNYRLRSSILVEYKNTVILIDATPDLRQQLIKAKVKKIDGVLITHSHADHIHGVDDFRFLNIVMNKYIDLYTNTETLEQIKKKFGYIFERLHPKANGFFYKPCLNPIIIKTKFKINELIIDPFDQDHGFGKSLGFRINNFAYSSDVVELSEEAFEKLYNLDLWIVDCLRVRPHKTHAHLEKTLKWIERVKPKKAVITHMNNETDYDEITKLLPKNCFAAFDGMKLKI
tara:strand:+ start:668 stop:1444 length:777 start_codon:yes stop_codon:yes gene_type:complete